MAGQPQPTIAPRMYASIRDQLASEITAGVYPAGALLPSIREVMQRWDVSTTTARRVLDELAASGFARKEGTRGHISTGGPQAQQAPPAAEHEHSRKAPPPAGVPGRLTIRSAHTIPACEPQARTRPEPRRLMSAPSDRPPMSPGPASRGPLAAGDRTAPPAVRCGRDACGASCQLSAGGALARPPPSRKPRRFLRRGPSPWPPTLAGRSAWPAAMSPPVIPARKKLPPLH